MMRRVLMGSTVLAALMVCGAASAQETPPTPPPPVTDAPPADPAPAVPLSQEPTQVVAPPPVQAQTTTTVAPAPVPVSTTTTTSAEQSGYVVQEKRCGLVDHSCRHPHLEFALDGGGAGFNESGPFGFNTSIGHVTSAGPSWGARVGADLLPWLGVDAHYIGMNNQVHGAAVSTAGGTGLLTTGATLEVRFIAPLPYVQPYAIVGGGVYHTALTGNDAAQANSQLYSGTSWGMPLGVGLNVPIQDGVSVGAEAVYHRLFGESYSNNTDFDGGDITTFNAVVRAKL